MNRIVINGAFRPQRVTGQQRYATEITAELLKRDGVREKRPSVSASSLKSWAWAQCVGFDRSPNEFLLTLTSRGPLRARRHIVVVHDLFVLDHPEWYSKKFVATHAPILRSQLASAAGLVTVSAPTETRVRELVGGKKPVVTAPNAPASVFTSGGFDETSLMAVEAHGLHEFSYFLAVGSVDPRKNIETVIQAFRSLPLAVQASCPLVLVGAENPVFGRIQIEDFPNIHKLGYVSDQLLASLYAYANLVVFPSLDEGFGLPVVEALSAGARVAVSRTETLEWVAGDAASYVLPALNVGAWSRAMLNSFELTPDQRPVKTERVRGVASRFSWNRSANIIFDFVGELSDA